MRIVQEYAKKSDFDSVRARRIRAERSGVYDMTASDEKNLIEMVQQTRNVMLMRRLSSDAAFALPMKV